MSSAEDFGNPGPDAIRVHPPATNAGPTERTAAASEQRSTLAPTTLRMQPINRPSIRISRAPSAASIQPQNVLKGSAERISIQDRLSGRGSRPVTPDVRPGSSGVATSLAQPTIPAVEEVEEVEAVSDPGATSQPLTRPAENAGRLRRASVAARSLLGMPKSTIPENEAVSSVAPLAEYDPEFVHMLDVVDPEVSTLSTLTNVQNSLFVPDLGSLLERRPTYTLTRPTQQPQAPVTVVVEKPEAPEAPRPDLERTQTANTITSMLDETHFAVLPHGVTLDGWSVADKEALNDHVRHMLHSRRAKFRRGLKGFGQYVRRPLGFLITLYATLITLFGLAWVLFLIGWINVGGRQLYIIHVIDLVLVALFAVVGDGLAPFRAIDTYHMIFIVHYAHLTWRLRKEQHLPKLENKNDLPSDQEPTVDVENGITLSKHEFSVLTPKQQERLTYHQSKFAKSHTFYKPHETTTHRAFPLHLLIAVVVLLDCHSLFQIALGTCTWAISYKVRPFALTTVILCCSITCNVAAGITISIGDRKTRKKEVVEKMFRQQLTKEAMHTLEKRREKERKRNADLEKAVNDRASSSS